MDKVNGFQKLHRGLIEKITEDVAEDIKDAVFKELIVGEDREEAWRYMQNPEITIILWQLLREIKKVYGNKD